MKYTSGMQQIEYKQLFPILNISFSYIYVVQAPVIDFTMFSLKSYLYLSVITY